MKKQAISVVFGILTLSGLAQAGPWYAGRGWADSPEVIGTSEQHRTAACNAAIQMAVENAITRCLQGGYAYETCSSARRITQIEQAYRPDPYHFSYHCEANARIFL